MPTLNPGSSVTLYSPLSSSTTVTITAPGRVSVNGRNVVTGAPVTPRELYSTETLSLVPGDQITLEAVGLACTYTEPTATGGSGSSSGGLGGDRTAVTTEDDTINGGKRVLTETVNGIAWTLSYDSQGRQIGATALSGNLTLTITYDADGFGTASGNYYRGSEIVVTESQMGGLKTALAALGSSMTAVPKFFVSDFDSGRGCIVEWNDVDGCFRGLGGAPIVYAGFATDSASHTGVSTSAALRTITQGGWLAGPRTRMICWATVNKTGETDTHTIRVRYDGTDIAVYSGISAANNFTRCEAVLNNRGATNVQEYSTGMQTPSSGSSVSTAPTAGAFDTTANTDWTIVMSFGGATDSAVVQSFWLSVQNP